GEVVEFAFLAAFDPCCHLGAGEEEHACVGWLLLRTAMVPVGSAAVSNLTPDQRAATVASARLEVHAHATTHTPSPPLLVGGHVPAAADVSSLPRKSPRPAASLCRERGGRRPRVRRP